MFRTIWFASFIQLILLYSVVIITFFYLLNKYHSRSFYILIILLFFPALFDFLGKDFLDIYKIIVLFFTLWISINKSIFSKREKGDNLIITSFLFFCISFFLAAITNNDNWTIIFSQLSRYIIAFCLWFLIRKELYFNKNNTRKISRFVYDLILMQIIITLAKFLIFEGKPIESIVGSISFTGGASGSILPILGFIGLWFYKNGALTRRDWFYTAGLLLIGFMAGKRAIWFIIPMVVIAFMVYIPRLRSITTTLVLILITPLIFYFGVRLTPSLNPEKKVGGTFDLGFAFDYANNYQFGPGKEKQGRGGATMLLLNKWTVDKEFNIKDLLGSGLSNMYSVDYDEFRDLNLEINWKGSASGVYGTYITSGYVGVFATILFFSFIVLKVKNPRIRFVLLLILAWEYFMYTGLIFRTPAFMFLIIYFVHYSNILVIQQTSIIHVNKFGAKKVSLKS